MADIIPLVPIDADDNPFNKPDACRICTLFREPGIVKGVGNRNAKTFHLGEAPGAEEVDWPVWYNREKHGEPRSNLQVELRRRAIDDTPVLSSVGFRPERMAPFVGGSGRIRAVLLAQAGIQKEAHLYTTNCVKCRPPNNRLPTEFEVACCAQFLIEELEDVNPNLIIAAGELSLQVVTGKKKIGIHRGVVTEGPSRGEANAIDMRYVESTDRWLTAAQATPAALSREVGDGGDDASSPRDDGRFPGGAAPVEGQADIHGKTTGLLVREELSTKSYKVFPTWHPAFIMRAQYQWAFAVHDLVRAKAESSFPEIRRIPFTVNRRANLTDTRADLLRDIRARGAATFDFETTNLDPEYSSIRMVGIVGRPDQAQVYDWSLGAQQLFEDIFADPTIEICGQNILYFDIPFAEHKGHKVRWDERIFDTMVVMHLCNSSYGQVSVKSQNSGSYAGARGTEKDLSFIASNYTDIEYWKSRDAYKNDIYGVCGVDVIATDHSAYGPQGLKQELKSYDMLDLYYKHVLPVHRPLHAMTKRGVKIDEDRAARWAILLEQNADRLEATLKEGLGDPFLNLASPKQLMTLFYEKLGLPVQYTEDKKKGRRPTANAEAIEELARIAPENKILMSIVDIRHLRKMKSTYVDPGLQRGRLHPRFGVSKAANGRFNGWDPNAQNVPEEMRDIWIPDDPDHVLISADSSQIEWRVAMVLSGDPVGLELLASGVDNHRAIAAETMGIPYDEITAAQRHMAKFIVYGLGYGRGAASIAEGHGFDLRKTEEFIRKFFDRFQVFNTWRNELPAQVQRDHFLANPFKRRRWWYTREITEIYNFPASSTAADMMYEEVIALENQLPTGATLRLTVHDEVVVNCPKDIIRQTIECMRTLMQAPQPIVEAASRDPQTIKKYYPNGWFCPADVHIGSNWKMCKSKDPQDVVARTALEKHLGLA